MEPREIKENRIAKILVPLLIIIAVFFVWMLKNKPISQAEITVSEENPDFLLEASADFELEKLFEYELPVILDFGASWCGPCQIMKPTMVKLNESLRGQAIIKYVDVDELPEFTANFPVTVVPTQFFYMADGTPYDPGESAHVELLTYKRADTGEHALTAHEGYLDEQALLIILKEMGLELLSGTGQ